ncbi:MAG: biotin--[acetyl-CoA-carboxylase] ligase [Desulfobulbaceae bacterium]|nr:biotin--[acetyl-CoA-carboxylase] ligase [Desulfobulbaceae bacterium]
MERAAAEGFDPLWQGLRDRGRLGGRQVHFLAETDSTNDVALALGRAGTRAGSLVVAESQNCGRGRLGRVWLSPSGCGIYCSLVLRPRLAPGDLAKITLAAGLGVAKAVEAVASLYPAIKWPNDLLLDGRKCGGILTEGGGFVFGQPLLVVVGIGLNVLTPQAAFPEELRQRATSLYAHSGRPVSRGSLLVAMVEAVEGEVQRLERGGFAAVLAQWRQRDAVFGKRLAWLTPEGGVVEGVALGPDDEGILHIRDDGGRVHEVLSGDLTLHQK